MMLDLADATVVLNSLVALLKNCAGLDLTVKVHHPHTTGDPSQPDLMVELAGSDTPLLLQRDGELLHAFEHLACVSLHLQPDDLPRIAFDANGFRANRARHLELLAEQAVSEVRLTHEPHVFPPMNARDRRILHLALAPSGLTSASTGERFSRAVVLYPEGTPPRP